jgi:enoyl-CoA hydratase/carnithine racemase
MCAVKRVLAAHSQRRVGEEPEQALEADAHERSTEDFGEGVRAFLERRRADWPRLKARVLR